MDVIRALYLLSLIDVIDNNLVANLEPEKLLSLERTFYKEY